MPHRLDTHVLTVDANVIHKVDTANPAHLQSIWTDSVPNGRRLENFSWRLWQQEQLRESRAAAQSDVSAFTTSQPQTINWDSRLPEVPQLSGSVDSVVDEEAVEFTSVSAPEDIARPRIRRQDSSSRHITSDNFEKMVMSIVKDKTILSAPTHTAKPHSRFPEKAAPLPSMQRSGSTTTESQSPSKNSDMMHSDVESQPSPEAMPRTQIVRGFSPSKSPVPLSTTSRLQTQDVIPPPTSEPAAKHVQTRKAPAFQLGGSCSSSEQGASFENRSLVLPGAKKSTFKIGVSSEEEGSLRSALHSGKSAKVGPKKTTSFSQQVSVRPAEYADNAIDSDSEDDYVDESAIDDDDDSSDWEDSAEDTQQTSVDQPLFQRVDSQANLKRGRSLISLALAKNQRSANLGGPTSQSTSALRAPRGPETAGTGSLNDSDDSPLMMRGNRSSRLGPITEQTNGQAIPSRPNPNQAQVAFSARTTRRNMLAEELPGSLRRHMIHERSQKSSTINAHLKRRHTSHDVANLQQYPQQGQASQQAAEDSAHWDYLADEQYNGYHSKGW